MTLEQDARCRTDGCTRKRQRNRSLCAPHLRAWLAGGEPVTRAKAGEGHLTERGYRTHHLPGHPLAARNGSVRRARVALFEALGGQDPDCRWCGGHLSWALPQSDPAAVTVDHLSGDRTDDRPENLIAAHRACNTARVRRGNRLDFARLVVAR